MNLFIMEISSQGYGTHELPQSGIGKLEKKESQGCNSAGVRKSEKQELMVADLSKGLRTKLLAHGKDECFSSNRENAFILCHLVLVEPSID